MRPCASLASTSLVGSTKADAPKTRSCPRCRAVRFCCQGCPNAAWPDHRLPCTLLAAHGTGEKQPLNQLN